MLIAALSEAPGAPAVRSAPALRSPCTAFGVVGHDGSRPVRHACLRCTAIGGALAY
jgi:hypothetical protein